MTFPASGEGPRDRLQAEPEEHHQSAEKRSEEWRDIGLGVILAAFVILLPRGLVGLAAIRKRRGAA